MLTPKQSFTVTTKTVTVKNNTSNNKLKEKTLLKNKTTFAIYTWLNQRAFESTTVTKCCFPSSQFTIG